MFCSDSKEFLQTSNKQRERECVEKVQHTLNNKKVDKRGRGMSIIDSNTQSNLFFPLQKFQIREMRWRERERESEKERERGRERESVCVYESVSIRQKKSTVCVLEID